MDAASRRLLLMSFKRHREIYPNGQGADQNADAPAHHSDEFPAGYSLTRCSPAALVSASPAGLDYPAALAQLRVLRGKTTKRIALKMKTV
jgi:hypothetical protein